MVKRKAWDDQEHTGHRGCPQGRRGGTEGGASPASTMLARARSALLSTPSCVLKITAAINAQKVNVATGNSDVISAENNIPACLCCFTQVNNCGESFSFLNN